MISHTYYYHPEQTTRRSQRLTTARSRRAKQQKFWRGLATALAAVILIILVGVLWRAVNASVERAKIEQAKLAEQAKIAKNANYVLNRDLPTKIAELNQTLDLPVKTPHSDLPAGDLVAVSVIDLSGKNRVAVDYNGNAQFTAASTYKLFVAYEMIHAVETGRLSWHSPLNGMTLDACLQKMIVVSDNDCPQAWVAKYSSFAKLTTTARNLGMSSVTDFTFGNMRTSSGDLAKFLQLLYQGQLMSADNRQKLLGLMEQQQYRAGIPAGILAQINSGAEPTGTSVADKVGFLDTLKNDAAIVFSAKGDYILVIMSNGETTVSGSTDWRFTAALASWIDGQINQ